MIADGFYWTRSEDGDWVAVKTTSGRVYMPGIDGCYPVHSLMFGVPFRGKTADVMAIRAEGYDIIVELGPRIEPPDL